MINCDDMQVVPFDGVGAEIRGLRIGSTGSMESESKDTVSSDQFILMNGETTRGDEAKTMKDSYCIEQFRLLWNKYSVLLVRDQELTENSMLELALHLGDPKPAGSRGYYMRAGNPHGSGRTSSLSQVSIMSNLDANGQPVNVTSGHGSQSVDWHQDDSYTNAPARGALLYNTHHPVNGGGNTSFCNLYAAYETLPQNVQDLIASWHLVHDISRNSAGHVRPGLRLPQTWEEVEGPAHPLVIVHPVTGRKALHLGRKQPAPTSLISELPTVEGHALLDYLWHHAITTATWTHDSWRPGDLVLWDNLATMHKRSSVDPKQRREMLRVLLRGSPLTGVLPNVKTIATTANDKADHEARVKDSNGDFVSFRNKTHHFVKENSSNVTASPVNSTATCNDCIIRNQNSNATCPTKIPGVSSSAEIKTDVELMKWTFLSGITSNDRLTKFGLFAGFLTVIVTCMSRFRRMRQQRQEHDKNITFQHQKSSSMKSAVATDGANEAVDSTKPATLTSQEYLSELRVQVFWWFFLVIYISFQSFSCGRADRLWRISDVYNEAPRVLLKPYGISFLWYEALAPYMATVENLILVTMVVMSLFPLFFNISEIYGQRWMLAKRLLIPGRRLLCLVCGLGWLYLHAYEHSLTGGSHTHLMPGICMTALALPPKQSVNVIRQWNVFLLFSAGLSKLFNGSHHAWWAWMDGQSMQFYFDNSRRAVPEPFYTWTMPPNHGFAAAQCTFSVIFELSTILLLVSQSYRLLFPFMGAIFHGMIWYTLGVNYLTSVVIQFTLVLDREDWKCLGKYFMWFWKTHWASDSEDFDSQDAQDRSLTTQNHHGTVRWKAASKTKSANSSFSHVCKIIPVLNALILVLTIVQQVEFWPLSNIPMYSGYRPHVGYNTTHIANRTYLDHLILETAPHVWSRHWTNVMVTHHDTGKRSKMTFCARNRQDRLARRGVKDLCLVPEGNMFDTERDTEINDGEMFRVEPPSSLGKPDKVIRHSMRPGGWNRQKPIVVMAELPGRYHVYCQNKNLSPAQDWLHRNCAFLKSMGISDVQTELIVHLGTGDLVVASINCANIAEQMSSVDRVPHCKQNPWHWSP